MAKEKKRKSPAKKKPDLSNRPLELSDLPKSEQRDAVSLVSGLSETMPEQFESLAHTLRNAKMATQISSRRKYEAAAPQAERKPLTLESMAETRVNSFMRALSGPHRLPTEDYSGQEFYFQHRKEIDETRRSADAPDIPLGRVLGATARLSVRTDPASEKASASALLHAHAKGSVNYTPELVQTLGQRGVSVPTELHGRKVPFSETPAHIVGAMVDPDVRESVVPHLDNVDLFSISKSSMTRNITGAHSSLQGENLPSPTVNPKQFSYQRAHEMAVPSSPEHGEYQLRAMNLGQVARGEQSPNQMMFDFYNLRESNEGVLSNKNVLAEDSWMNAVSFDQPAPIKKAAGDVTLSAKKGTTKRGRDLSVGAGNKDITPLGIQHAVNAAATSRAAQLAQEQLGVDYTVPSMMIQEGVWSETRRDLGKDPEYNAARRAEKEKKPKKPKSPPTLF